jgi:membrane protein
VSSTASDNHPGAGRRRDYRPKGISQGTSLFATLKRTVTEFSEDNLSDWAASLTYYGLLALFPALLALVGLLGLVGDPHSTTKTITQIVTKIGPSSAAQTFAGPIKSITAHKSTAGIMGIVGLAAALWSASSYVGAFMRASNVIYETPEGRPIWKLRPLQVLVTLIMIVLLALVALALVLTGPIVNAVAQPLGVGSTAVTIWDIAKWPVLLIVVITMFAVLFYASPNVKLAGFKWVTPGALFAIVVWLIASALFAFYVANFSSYDKTYGTLAGVAIFLVWMWLTNTALLLGMELNAERERSRELKAGIRGADRELQLDARSAPKRQKTT